MRLLLVFTLCFLIVPNTHNEITSNGLDVSVRGWTILSDSRTNGLAVLEAAASYDINHLQISHDIIHELREVRDENKRDLASFFIDAAHSKGIKEVLLWDHTLYELNYYPEEYRTGPDGLINLDNPAFWEWLKKDYREMLDLVPNIQGIILTFVETGARIENQYSTIIRSEQEKLAKIVDAIADVVINERGMNLYARTFAYSHKEYNNILGAIELFQNEDVRLMIKESPHDFFLTHPANFFLSRITRPTLIEFDAAAEFNGQGIIANTWPEFIIHKMDQLLKNDNIIGYVARTDRFGDTRIIGKPSEINLLALKMYFQDTTICADDVYEKFVKQKYGEEAFPLIKCAFQNSYEIVTSIFYTLGIHTTNHSRLNYDPCKSHWARHVTGKWVEPPLVFIEHHVNKRFHYWKDVVNTLAPCWAKSGGSHLEEIPWVVQKGWLTEEELMNEEYLKYIMAEKEYGIELVEQSLEYIELAKVHIDPGDYDELLDYFYRTLLTARLHKAVSTAYFGFRIYTRGEPFRTKFLADELTRSLSEIKDLSAKIKNYPSKPASGQWNWEADADMAMQYYEWITKGTWPETTYGFQTHLNGISFPLVVGAL